MKDSKIEALIRKYNVPAPRYTSYPTVPYWDTAELSLTKWQQIVKKAFDETNEEKGISLYIHLPFCESLCTYCGCNKRITKNHKVEDPYIEAVLEEWHMYRRIFGKRAILRELHLGGGTPTFFSPRNLKWLVSAILESVEIHPVHDFSFEGHPNNTTIEHLQVLYDQGFRRVSFGVQDLDMKVQVAINRIQPFKNVKDVTAAARAIGYTSINFDLIYGLPFQTLKGVGETIDKVGELMPDRIAFYSYAHVPWLRTGQRGYADEDLPDSEEKRQLYELGKEKLTALGYVDIGMDHFSLPGDKLYKAAKDSTLHRNFMGYTVCNTDLLVGLGTSAISDAKYGYAQNAKVVEAYKEKVLEGRLPVFKGHEMTEEDLRLRSAILTLLCQNTLSIDTGLSKVLDEECKRQFEEMQEEGLVEIDGNVLKVTELGRAFIRNIAMVLDKRLQRKKPSESPVFSKAI